MFLDHIWEYDGYGGYDTSAIALNSSSVSKFKLEFTPSASHSTL